MTVMTPPKNAYRALWDSLCSDSDVPAWLADVRSRGWARFEKIGFPTLAHEDWRFTDVTAIADGTFVRPDPGAVPDDLPAGTEYDELDGPRLIFADGRFVPAKSSIGDLPEGVIVGSLADALITHADLVRPHLSALADDDEAFTALNDAFVEDGLFVFVPKGVDLPGAVEARFVATSGSSVVAHPRSLVILEESASATVLEDYVSHGSDTPAAFTNAVTQFIVGANAQGRHYLVEREHEETYVVATLYITQQRDSYFASHSALIGGRLVRNNVFPTMDGEGCMSVANGMYIPHGVQLHDNRMRVRHAKPRCESRQYYHGILADKSKAMFSGRIIVEQDAQQTDAVQSNKNLLLSNDALVETKPQLEIYADDVKCTHGATTGQIDEQAIFYFRSRGISEQEARRQLTFAFVNEIFERMELEPVRARLRTIVADRLAKTLEG